MTSDQPRPSPRPRPRPAPAPDASLTDAPPTDAAPHRSTSRRRRGPITLATLAVLVIALLTANLVLRHQRADDRAVEAARTDAVAAARTRVPALLSYTYRSIDTYLRQAPANATGAFRTEFGRLLRTVVAPAARSRQIVTTAQLRSVGVLSARRSEVALLVLLDQTSYGSSSKTARVDGSRVRVTMRRTDGSWLIAGLTPI